jgi:4-hydroxy-2-oxoheptanedioate aldolase
MQGKTMQSANKFLRDLKSSQVSLGAWQMFPSPSVSRTIARVPGISWVLIDGEHGNVGDSEMHECIANIAPYGVSPLVRLPDKERWMIKRALDAGAHGIMVPLLSAVEEIEEVVRQVLSSFSMLRSRRNSLQMESEVWEVRFQLMHSA